MRERRRAAPGIIARTGRRKCQNGSVSIAALLRLPSGEQLLRALPNGYTPEDVFKLSARLRADGYAAEYVNEALTQLRLRTKAAEKFGSLARSLLYTAAGLEQATRLSVAAVHARRFLDSGIKTVVDFGCGIGADSYAFADLGLHTRSFEKDPDAAAAARYNLRRFGNASVFCADGFTADLTGFGAEGIWIDPARRKNAIRLKDPGHWIPPLPRALDLAGRFSAAGIKTAPGIPYSHLPENSAVSWISVDGELPEAVIWTGAACPAPKREAVVIRNGHTYIYAPCEAHDPRTAAKTVTPRAPGKYIFEPDPAIIRSGQISRLCTEFGLAPISDKIAYLSGDVPVSTPFCTAFEVLYTGTLNMKKTGKILRQMEIGILEIKKRGTDLQPEAMRKALRTDPRAPHSATLFATRVMGKHRAIIARRIRKAPK